MALSELWFKIVSAIGAVTGTWALLRSYWLTRSKLVLLQKSGHSSAYHNGGREGMLELFVIAANRSSQANAIVRWEAWMKTRTGEMKQMPVPRGRETRSGTDEVLGRFNVTPINIPPHGTVEAKIELFHLTKSDFAEPLETKLRITDMYGKQFECVCFYPART